MPLRPYESDDKKNGQNFLTQNLFRIKEGLSSRVNLLYSGVIFHTKSCLLIRSFNNKERRGYYLLHTWVWNVVHLSKTNQSNMVSLVQIILYFFAKIERLWTKSLLSYNCWIFVFVLPFKIHCSFNAILHIVLKRAVFLFICLAALY